MNVEVDTDYKGNALDLHIPPNTVVSMRRFGTQINFTVVGSVALLSADQAEEIAQSLLAAAQLARTDPGGGYGREEWARGVSVPADGEGLDA